MSLTAPLGVLYPRSWQDVKRHGTFGRVSAVVCGIGLLAGGCANAPKARSTDYLIALRYDVEPRLIGGNLSQKVSAVRSDFKTVSDLGFNGVVLFHAEDRDRGALLDLAGEVGLRAAVPDRRFERFVVTGEWPTGCRSVGDLTSNPPDPIVHHPAFHSYVVECGRGRSARERSRRLRLELLRKGTPYLSLEGEEETRPAVIDSRTVRDGPPGAAIERLLTQYHEALCAGQTGGVIVDRFMRVPGDPPGLTSPDDPLLPAHTAAIAELVQRARCWGPRLRGLSAAPLDAAATGSSRLTTTVFGHGARRHVLVFNRSADRFAREEVRLPASVLGASVQRAVEVPPSSARGAGRVVQAQRGQLTLPVELRPGDAALFEVFTSARTRSGATLVPRPWRSSSNGASCGLGLGAGRMTQSTVMSPSSQRFGK